MPKIQIQLLTHGRADALSALFDSLLVQTDQDWDVHVMVNGATEPMRGQITRVLEAYRERLLLSITASEVNLGFAGGHQQLFENHSAKYVLLVNDDVVLAPEYIACLRRFLDEHPHVGAVSGKLLRPDRRVDSLGLTLHASGKVSNIDEGKVDRQETTEPYEVFGVSGTLPLLRREAVVHASHDGRLFDPVFGSYKEDVELAFRLRSSGWKSLVVPQAVAVHHRTFRKSCLHRGVSFYATSHSYRNHWWNILTFYSWGEYGRSAWALVPFELAKLVFFLVTNPRVIFWSITSTWRHRQVLLAKRRHMMTPSHLL